MIQLCITLKNLSSRFLFVVIICLLSGIGISSHAQFRSNRDRQIVINSLNYFQSECGLKKATDAITSAKVNEYSALAAKRKISDLNLCFENQLSQITSISFLYSSICDDVSSTSSEASDSTLARQMLEVSKYQNGISAFHNQLNECLENVKKNKGEAFVIPQSRNELAEKSLSNDLLSSRVEEPFAATIEPFR
jgi:hypothetical protein